MVLFDRLLDKLFERTMSRPKQQGASTSGYKDLFACYESEDRELHKKETIAFLIAAMLAMVFDIASIFMSEIYSWLAMFIALMLVSIAFLSRRYVRDQHWKYSALLSCPYCRATFRENITWRCPKCGVDNGGSILGPCYACSHAPQALTCPFCSQTIILTEPALSWSKDLVDEHTARQAIAGASATPEPEPQPEPEPVDPVIQMMDEFVKSNLGRHEFIQMKREEVRQKYGDNPPEFVQSMMGTLENMVYKYRENESRGSH